MTISGVFNGGGYAVLSDGEAIYSAGNSPDDSQVYMGDGASGSLGICVIEQYCRQTAKDLAEERNESLGTCIEADNASDYFVGG